jgi:hypothetical protein
MSLDTDRASCMRRSTKEGSWEGRGFRRSNSRTRSRPRRRLDRHGHASRDRIRRARIRLRYGRRRRRQFLASRSARQSRCGPADARMEPRNHRLLYVGHRGRQRRRGAPSDNRQIPQNVTVNLDATLHANAELGLVSPGYVFASPVLGGQLAVSMAAIGGRFGADINGVLTATSGSNVVTREGNIGDSRYGVGDLYPLLRCAGTAAPTTG